jgi:hypothetical protein
MGSCLSQCIIHYRNSQKETHATATSGGVHDYILQTDLDTECAICLETLKMGHWMSLLPCGHIFHTQCVFAWFNQKKVCPYCETPVEI